MSIALFHPHYYFPEAEWAETFNALICIHEDEKEWVVHSSDKIIFWSGESFELPQVTLFNT
ncbi:Uncharacterized protein BCF24048_02582 [Bacillus cereus]|uniref:Uncharacterized protein n=1 Tax=Bacillus cereus TaxID=1396 RepID=A0A1D3NEE7_BACCE|nr:hypothetical protein CN307_07570 [Bacillus cereus]SCM96698.1 Uncharacterized protein BCF24048_02582 [Bacillus cereus]